MKGNCIRRPHRQDPLQDEEQVPHVALLTHSVFYTHAAGRFRTAKVETMLDAYEREAKDMKRYLE